MLRRAQHERDGGVYSLHCHSETPAHGVTSVTCACSVDDGDEVLLTFTVTGATTLVVPAPASPTRTDELWRTTCFELFWKAEGTTDYVELNLSPSGQWAAYAFDGYRAGMVEQPMVVDPHIETFGSDDQLVVEIDVDFATFPAVAASVGLSAVIEETNGTKSYWALAHPPGKPDFHHPDCFALTVPAVG